MARTRNSDFSERVPSHLLMTQHYFHQLLGPKYFHTGDLNSVMHDVWCFTATSDSITKNGVWRWVRYYSKVKNNYSSNKSYLDYFPANHSIAFIFNEECNESQRVKLDEFISTGGKNFPHINIGVQVIFLLSNAPCS